MLLCVSLGIQSRQKKSNAKLGEYEPQNQSRQEGHFGSVLQYPQSRRNRLTEPKKLTTRSPTATPGSRQWAGPVTAKWRCTSSNSSVAASYCGLARAPARVLVPAARAPPLPSTPTRARCTYDLEQHRRSPSRFSTRRRSAAPRKAEPERDQRIAAARRDQSKQAIILLFLTPLRPSYPY